MLRIRIGKYPVTLLMMTAIGHELRHAIEVLSNPDIRSTGAMQLFYLRNGSRRPGGAMETYAAILAVTRFARNCEPSQREDGAVEWESWARCNPLMFLSQASIRFQLALFWATNLQVVDSTRLKSLMTP